MKTRHKKTRIRKSMKRRGGATIERQFNKLSFNLEDIKNKLGALATFMGSLQKSTNGLTHESLETNATNFLKVHFKTEPLYTETYSNNSIFMLDPLLNDIDDIFAFIYFFYLSLAYKITTGAKITLYICIEDIDPSNDGFVTPNQFQKINSYTDAMVDYCTQVDPSITVVKLDTTMTSTEPATLFIHRGYTKRGIKSIFERFKIKQVIMNGNVNIHNKNKPIDIHSQSDYDSSVIPSNLKQGLKFYKKNKEPKEEVLTPEKRLEQFQTYIELWEKADMYVLPLTRAERLISLYFDNTKGMSHIRPREINDPFLRKPEWGSDVIVKMPVEVKFSYDTMNVPELNKDYLPKEYPHFPYSDYKGDLMRREDYYTPSHFLPYLQGQFKEMETHFDSIKTILNHNIVDCNVTIYAGGDLKVENKVPFGEICFPNRKPFATPIDPTVKTPKYLLNDGTFTCEENGSFMIDALTVMATLGDSTKSTISVQLDGTTFKSQEQSNI